MRVIIQRTKKASVCVQKKEVGKIDKGMCILVGFTDNDTEADIDYMVKKILNLRIFDDEDGKRNKNILDTNGSILSISQFTLYADTKKGNRPSYKDAMNGENAIKLYNQFNEKLKKETEVQTGIFGAEMLVSIENDGPITIMLDSKNR